MRWVFLVGLVGACSSANSPTDGTPPPLDSESQDRMGSVDTNPGDSPPSDSPPSDSPGLDSEPSAAFANVTRVEVGGEEGAYSLSVTIASPDEGCEQYANYWEVLTPEGTLVYRRILGHSHVDEQPFTRSGGPVDAAADAPLVVRAHMFPSGYGGTVFTGTVASGFSAAVPPTGLPSEADVTPDCAF